MIVINLFGGPGCGKSSIAGILFGKMKFAGMNVELVTEYAKEPVWEGNHVQLEDQLYITASQNRRMWMVKDKVDFVITDSPLLLGIHYVSPQYFPDFYKDFVWDLWNYYDNYNIRLVRTKPYSKVGRYQSEGEAKEIDAKILDMLNYQVKYYTDVDGDINAPDKIMERLEFKNM